MDCENDDRVNSFIQWIFKKTDWFKLDFIQVDLSRLPLKYFPFKCKGYFKKETNLNLDLNKHKFH